MGFFDIMITDPIVQWQKGDECYRKQNYTEAVSWWEKAAQQGHLEAQWRLGLCYSNGLGVRKNLNTAFNWYSAAANSGHVKAQQALGELYYQTAPPNFEEAAKWFLLAAQNGFAPSQRCYGSCCFYGTGVTKDVYAAVAWYKAAADQGDYDALDRYAYCLLNGLGVRQNQTEAASRFWELAQKGYPISQFHLAHCYMKNKGVPQDYTQAFYWYLQSARKGVAFAQYYLGVCYALGLGVEMNMCEARIMWGKAAEQHIRWAQRAIKSNNRSKVFIAHTVDALSLVKWRELSNYLERLNYEVFDDQDAGPLNDISYCFEHIIESDIIIVLVADTKPFGRNAGVFAHEIQYISQGVVPGKLVYICSYGIKDPLDLAVKEYGNDNQYLRRLIDVKIHNFNHSDMKEMALMINESYNEAFKD